MVKTGYGYVMPDQNGWSRYLHFQAAWVLVLTGLIYGVWGFWTGYFWRNLFPEQGDRTWRAYGRAMAKHLRRAPPDEADAHSYNVLQRTAYLTVIFVLFPLVIWTGLAMSPSFTAAFPLSVDLAGRAAVGAHASFLRFVVAGDLFGGPRYDGCAGGILEPYAGYDYRP